MTNILWYSISHSWHMTSSTHTHLNIRSQEGEEFGSNSHVPGLQYTLFSVTFDEKVNHALDWCHKILVIQ